MRPKTRVLALISHAQTHKCRILAAGIAKCSQQTSSFQVRLLGFPFPAPIMVKISPTWPLSYSWAGQDANQVQHSSFLPHLSVPPLLQYRCTVQCTQPPLRHTEHMTSKKEYSKGRSQIFLAVILFGSCPPRYHSWYSHNGSPFHSLLLIELVHVCLYLPKREQGWSKSYDSKTYVVFFPFIVPCIHANTLIQYF